MFSGPYPAWTTGRGCDIFRFDFDADNEMRIPGASTNDSSEVLPSIWRDRIAFARVYEERSGDRGVYPYLYTRPLDGGSSVRKRAAAAAPTACPAPSDSTSTADA